MASLSIISSLVVEQTRRPDIPAITSAAIKAAVLRAHHTDFFPRDLTSQSLTYPPPTPQVYYDFTNISALLPFLRNFESVTSVDSETFRFVTKVEYRELSDLYTSEGIQRCNTYSLLGDTLRISLLEWTGRLEVIYYKNPNVIADTINSWIADTYQEEIAAWAAGIVFARTGFMEQAQAYQELHVKSFKDTLVASHLLGEVN